MQAKRRKILFVMQLPPPVHGVSVMNKIIKDSGVINEALDCDYVNLATAKNIDDLQKNGFLKYLVTLKIVFKTFYKMATNRYDYVYITIFPWGFAFLKDSIIVILAKLFRLKPLLHLHTHGFKRNSEKSTLKKKYYRFVFKNTEVICLSDLLLEDVETIFSGKVFILPNGIPQVNFENNYNASKQPLTILYLSNLIKGKGVLILLDAAEKLKKKEVSFHLRIAGPEGDINYKMLGDLVKEKKLENNVTLAGPKFGNEKYDEFRNAGVFVLPSNYDTFGLVLLEAMQFGVPCISTNIGGIPDVLGEGRGIILSEITSEALAEALESFIRSAEKRLAASRLGFHYFQSNFTVGIFENRLKNILMGKPEKVNNRLMPAKT
jgi:glycosyltransferase involved in cell wall biosynthesis